MTDAPTPLVLVSENPIPVLRALGAAVRDVTVLDELPETMAPGTTLLLSSLSDGAVTARAWALVATVPGSTLALDVIRPPAMPETIPDGLDIVDWEAWGSCAIGVVGTGGGAPLASVDLVRLASVLPADSSELHDRIQLVEEQNASRRHEVMRARQRVRGLRLRLERQQVRMSEVLAARDRARAQIRELRASPEMLWGRRVAALTRRVPMGRLGLLLAGVATVVVAALLVLLTVRAPRVGAVAVLALLLVLLIGFSVSTLLVSLRAARAARVGPTPRGALARPRSRSVRINRRPSATDKVAVNSDLGPEIERRLARLELEVTDARIALSSMTASAVKEPARRATELARGASQIQAATQLFTAIGAEHRVPAMGGWAASPDLILLLVDELRRVRPTLVVECGSGVSTLWLALAIKKFGLDTKVVALEHHAGFGAETVRMLEDHGVADIVEVRIAPLADVGLPGHSPRWYHPSGWADLTDVGLLLVDGPPASGGTHVRYPALPLLSDKLSPTASIILDDMIRVDEQEVVKLWQDLMPGFERVDIDLEKKAAVLRRAHIPPVRDARDRA